MKIWREHRARRPGLKDEGTGGLVEHSCNASSGHSAKPVRAGQAEEKCSRHVEQDKCRRAPRRMAWGGNDCN